jgi:hypothetical protein
VALVADNEIWSPLLDLLKIRVSPSSLATNPPRNLLVVQEIETNFDYWRGPTPNGPLLIMGLAASSEREVLTNLPVPHVLGD